VFRLVANHSGARAFARGTNFDQNRSCNTTLRIPNTDINSQRPELSQNPTVWPAHSKFPRAGTRHRPAAAVLEECDLRDLARKQEYLIEDGLEDAKGGRLEVHYEAMLQANEEVVDLIDQHRFWDAYVLLRLVDEYIESAHGEEDYLRACGRAVDGFIRF
jgi:hypothetical protein